MMQCVLVDESAVGGEAGVIPILDVVPFYLIAPLIGAFSCSARFVVAPIGQELVANPVIIGLPHADIRVVGRRAFGGCCFRTTVSHFVVGTFKNAS